MKTRKELKQEYKLYKSPIGVFQIRNKTNGKLFVGSSTNLAAIWNRYRTQLNFGNHPNNELQNDWKEFGEDSFVYEILSELKQSGDENADYGKEVKMLEELYLEELQPFGEKGYNKKPRNK